MGCIVNGYIYCNDFMTCLSSNSSCPRGMTYTPATGCPIYGPCDFGYMGIGYVGQDQSLPPGTGGIPVSGSLSVVAPMFQPCYISLVNSLQNKL